MSSVFNRIMSYNMSIEKMVKISIIFGLVLVSLSLAYFFVYRPLHIEETIKRCNQQAGNRYNYKIEFEKCLRENGIKN